ARLDTQYAELKSKLATQLSPEEHTKFSAQLSAREAALLPIYSQISVQFADLHDRSGRMLAKGVINKELEWRHARRFFFWRLRRRLNEEYLLKRIAETVVCKSKLEKVARLKSWMPTVEYDDDEAVSNFIE
ncbi:hypothetical protein OXX80_014155, partial [Metschnikowia pulcherrima]